MDNVVQLQSESRENIVEEGHEAGVFDSLDLEASNLVHEFLSPNRIEGASSFSVPFYTLNGSRYFIPEVQPIHKPVVGTMFNSLGEALVMYKSYAEKAGFSVRKYTAKHKANGELSHRLFVCKTNVDSIQRSVEVQKLHEHCEFCTAG
ncbi:uncharacterized protein [Rutidosis leptorrhynchoides]|uniref:uncharacterized protein n=1 Tax=Rutidosis leptorrhynchoides TaxID=125765 RepID=UPI003A9967DB